MSSSSSDENEVIKIEKSKTQKIKKDIKDIKDINTSISINNTVDTGVIINIDDAEITLHKIGQKYPTPSPVY